LDTPVKIRLYCTQGDTSGDSQYLKGYAKQVRDLLTEYKQVAKGKITIEEYDPQPDSDAEDSARLDGIDPKMLRSGEQIYLGLCVEMFGEKQAIPFLDPSRERLLESLHKHRARPLILLVAPAGFGKSTLAAAYARDSGRWWLGSPCRLPIAIRCAASRGWPRRWWN